MTQALVLVDIQNDYFSGGTMALVGMDEATSQARAILDEFRTGGHAIFHIQHLAINPGATFFLPDTDGAKHNNTVKPQAGEHVIQKNYPNSFRATTLENDLRDADVGDIVIVGAMSHMCIDATTRAAFDIGFNCTVVEDACATRDLSFRNRTLAAREVHGAFMAALSAPYATVVSTREFLDR